MPNGKKGRGKGKVVALCLVCALVGGAAGGGAAALAWGGSAGDVSATSLYESGRDVVAVSTIAVPGGQEMTDAEIYAANVQSTVGITCDVVTTNFWGMPTTGAAAGSGFVVTEDGYIVTNYHVVEGATAVTVEFYDGTSYSAQVVGYDAENDLAVLKIDAAGLTPVVLGNSDQLNVGDHVLTIGNPLGELTFSLTQGSVSALNRPVTLSLDGTSRITMNLLQTDCAINSGNSGGALFNSYGEVVGITNAKYGSSSSGTSVDNIGFAIPINQVKNLISDLIEKGYVVKPYLGIRPYTVSQTDAQRYNLPIGVYVTEVIDGTCAQAAGVQQGDVIVAVNDVAIASLEELNLQKNKYAPGDEITLTVNRAGEEITLTVTLDETPVEETAQEEETQQQVQQQSQNSYQGNLGSLFGGMFGY